MANDELIQTRGKGLEDLETKGGSYLLPVDTPVQLTSDNYKNSGFSILSQGGVVSEWSPKDRTAIELSSPTEGHPDPSKPDLNFVIDVAPNPTDAFEIRNNHAEQPIYAWVYGERRIVLPGESITVPSVQPSKVEGVSDGVFYIQNGENEAIKIEKAPFNPEVKVTNCSLNKEPHRAAVDTVLNYVNAAGKAVSKDTPKEINVNYTIEQYNEAKVQITSELKRRKNQLIKDNASYQETLRASYEKFSTDVPIIIRNIEDEVKRYIEENLAALAWVDNPSDDPSQRKLVAGCINRIAQEDIRLALMESSSVEFNKGVFEKDWEAIEEKANKLKGGAHVLETYLPTAN